MNARLAPTVLVAGLAACNSAEPPEARTTVDGPVGMHPDGSTFLAELNYGGQSSDPRLVEVRWGRLVDVFGLGEGGGRVPMQREFVIAPGLSTDGLRYDLVADPVTGQTSLTILRDVGDAGGRAEFFRLLSDAEANLGLVSDVGMGSGGWLSMVPRNAALVLKFDDLLDARLVSAETVRLRVGSPPIEPFEARVLLDRNHGDLADPDGDGSLHFHSTRVVLDPTVDELEAVAQDPPMALNGLGFPAGASVDVASLQLRVPTRPAPSFGQEAVLRNLSGHALSPASNGTADVGSPTVDVVRTMRAGGSSDVTADPYNGFLADDEPPRLVRQQRLFVEAPPLQDASDPSLFTIAASRFESPACAWAPRVGDVLEQPLAVARVVDDASVSGTGVVHGLRVRLVRFVDEPGWPGAWSGAGLGPATLSTAFDAEAGVPAACVLAISPPGPDADEPGRRIAADATFGVRFSEAMDPASFSAFDSLVLTSVAAPTESAEFLVGEIAHSPDLRGFSFVPRPFLDHRQGHAEEVFLGLRSGREGPVDLAGNPLQAAPAPVRLQLDADQPTRRAGGRVARFSSPDEQAPFGDGKVLLPEWLGQHTYDEARGEIRPRPVSRFQASVDRSQPLMSFMSIYPGGIQSPLSPFGCRLMHIYRYLDVGFNLRDAGSYNVDVEGLHWAPAGGPVIADYFPRYELRLGHCNKAPDESRYSSGGGARHPNSGLTEPFGEQVLTPAVAPMVVVHSADRPYVIDPGDGFQTSTGTLAMPWPMNRDPSYERVTYTWRDTALLGRAGPRNNGVDPESVSDVGLQRDRMYGATNIQSIGLPLLVEHRCYPAPADAIGNNALEIVLGIATFRKPQFRVFSTGGFGPGGNVTLVDPDVEQVANGGFNPSNGGMRTPPGDPAIYLGAVDFVIRVSRSVSVWFAAADSAGALFEEPRFDLPLMEPTPAGQPPGTRVELAFRGAVSIATVGSAAEDPRSNARTLDLYGNYYEETDGLRNRLLENLPIVFGPGGSEWRSLQPALTDNPTGIDGSSYYQVRLTFVSNIESNLAPGLSSLAMSWE